MDNHYLSKTVFAEKSQLQKLCFLYKNEPPGCVDLNQQHERRKKHAYN